MSGGGWNRGLRAPERFRVRVKSAKKETFKLRGGPYAGASIRLTGPSTLEFRVRDMQGRYVKASNTFMTLDWEPRT